MALDFVIFTPSLNRLRLMRRQVDALAAEADRNNYTVRHLVVNDGSEDAGGYRALADRKYPSNYRLSYQESKAPHGRDGFWGLYQAMMLWAREYEFRYAVSLSDDLELCRDFLRRSSRHLEWLRRQDPCVVCLDVLSRWPSTWGTPRYEDGAFIAIRKFFDEIHWRIDPIEAGRWQGDQRKRWLSSGVHQQIVKKYKRLQHVRIAPAQGISFVRPYDVVSSMYPPEKFPGRAKPYPYDEQFIDEFAE